MNRSFLVALLMAASLGPVRAADDPRTIVQESQTRSTAASERYEGLLSVIDAKGKTSDKRWTFIRLGSHGNSKSVVRFTEPSEVKGVALLIVNHPDRASDQWMWTPALQRERRIALQDRSTRFFGTDFSFEDLEERDVDQFTYKMLADQAIDGAPCWHIEFTPTGQKTSQYTRLEVWIRKDTYALAEIDSYVKTELVRRLKYSNYVQVQNIWTAKRLEMTDLRRNSRTLLLLENLQYGVPLKDEEFTLPALRSPL